MKQTVDLYTFRRDFEQCRPTNFSYEGLQVLFDYLEAYESDCGTELELDVIALCCEYSEDTYEDVASNYGIDITDCNYHTSLRDTVVDYLEGETVVCGTLDDTVIYQIF
jgi:hypothetical protein